MNENRKIVYVEIVEDVVTDTSSSTVRQNIYVWDLNESKTSLTEEQLQNAASKLFEHMSLSTGNSGGTTS